MSNLTFDNINKSMQEKVLIEAIKKFLYFSCVKIEYSDFGFSTFVFKITVTNPYKGELINKDIVYNINFDRDVIKGYDSIRDLENIIVDKCGSIKIKIQNQLKEWQEAENKYCKDLIKNSLLKMSKQELEKFIEEKLDFDSEYYYWEISWYDDDLEQLEYKKQEEEE